MAFTDVTAVIIFVLAIVMVSFSDSEDFLKSEGSLNVVLLIILNSIFIAYMSFLLGKAINYSHTEYLNGRMKDLVENTAKFVRFPIIINFLFAIAGYFLLAFLVFPEKMKSGFSKDANSAEAVDKKKFLLI